MKGFILIISLIISFSARSQINSNNCNLYKRVNFNKKNSVTIKIIAEFISLGKCSLTYEERKRMNKLYSAFTDKNFLTSIEFQLPNCKKVYYTPIKKINKSIINNLKRNSIIILNCILFQNYSLSNSDSFLITSLSLP